MFVSVWPFVGWSVCNYSLSRLLLNVQIFQFTSLPIFYCSDIAFNEGGDIWLFITLFLFVGLTTWGDFYWILICCFFKLNVQTFQPLIVIYRKGNCVYIKDVHKLIDHCLIPLDPCIALLLSILIVSNKTFLVYTLSRHAKRGSKGIR